MLGLEDLHFGIFVLAGKCKDVWCLRALCTSKSWPQLCESLLVYCVQILGYLLPREEDEEDNFPSRTRRRQTVSAVEASVATLLDTNTVIQQSLVRTAPPATRRHPRCGCRYRS